MMFRQSPECRRRDPPDVVLAVSEFNLVERIEEVFRAVGYMPAFA